MKSKKDISNNTKTVLTILALAIIIVLTTIPGFADENLSNLVKKVQVNSQRAYDEISTVSYKGYSKSYVYFAFSPFDIKLVPFMDEYYFDGFWMKPDSLRLTIKARRTAMPDSNIQMGDTFPLPNPFRFIYDPSVIGINKLKDDSDDKWPLYPFALGADSLYEYQKISVTGFGDNRILSVKVVPKINSIPAVVGTFQIDMDKHVVVGSDVKFNEASSFAKASAKREKKRLTLAASGSENHRIKTKKTLLYGAFWLPTEVEEEFDIRIWGITVKIQRTIEFEQYFVDPEEPDSTLVVNQKIVYRRDPELEKKLFADTLYQDRLTKEEKEQIVKSVEDRFSAFNLYSELIESDAVAREAIKLGLESQVGRYFRFAQQLESVCLGQHFIRRSHTTALV